MTKHTDNNKNTLEQVPGMPTEELEHTASDNHDAQSEPAEAVMINVPKQLDSEHQQQIIEQIKELLKKQALVENVLSQQEGSSDRAELVQTVLKRKHEAELGDLVNHLHPADIAFILESLPSEDRIKIWNAAHADHDGDILLEVDDWVREELIAEMDQDDILAATEDLDADELADLIPDLPPEVVVELQKSMSDEEREQLRSALGYPEGTVGAIMDFEVVRVREDVTLEVVLRYLRMLGELPEHTDQLFVVDRNNKLKGVLSLSSLLVNDSEKSVTEVMQTDYLSLKAEAKDSKAASAFERYDLVSAPVIDEEQTLIGRVTITDIVDVIREDSNEHALSQAGLQEEDIFVPIRRAIPNRAPWLLINLITASIASVVASRFEGTVSHIVILAFLMSIVAGIGGNSGNQTMTMVIRALAVGRVNQKNARTLLRRELFVTSCVGLGGSLIAGTFAWIFSGSIKIALVMAAAMVLNMQLGATLGVLIPMIRDRFNKDPALGSSVLLTFATDSLGFFIFLGLATIFLM